MDGTSPLPTDAFSLPTAADPLTGMEYSWSVAAASGTAVLRVPLPVTSGPRFSPALALVYDGGVAQSEFGQGWRLDLASVRRRTSKGVPGYTDDDVVLGPHGQPLLPWAEAGMPAFPGQVSSLRGVALGAPYDVARFVSRLADDAVRWERWRRDADDFWMVHEPDGTLHVFGRQARTEANDGGKPRIAEWMLDESVSVHGEHILYEYVGEDATGLVGGDEQRDHANRRYVARIRYGNTVASYVPFVLDPSTANHWLFDVVFDYGQREAGDASPPAYDAERPWPRRSSPYSRFDAGFEIRTLRLCTQVLMFHTFSAAAMVASVGKRVPTQPLNDAPVLVGRLRMDHDRESDAALITAFRYAGYGRDGRVDHLPPLECRCAPPTHPARARFEPFAALGPAHGLQSAHAVAESSFLVDLYGEGLAGVLTFRRAQWWYREPIRGSGLAPDDIAFAPPELLTTAPVVVTNTRDTGQWMADHAGNGTTDWTVVRAGMAGRFSWRQERGWAPFEPFSAFPSEELRGAGTFVPVMGTGLPDYVVIGRRNVRVYANQGSAGYAAPVDVPHDADDLPCGAPSVHAWTGFADMLGSGQPQWVAIRCDGIRVWPNLGGGMFGAAVWFASLGFDEREFDARRIRVADLDGTGSADVLYLRADRVDVFMNRTGNGLAAPAAVRWPEGKRYDRFCQVQLADLLGLGFSSLIFSCPHAPAGHWRCDFAGTNRPGGITEIDNNMGAATTVAWRSSTQEWLDEKQAARAAGTQAIPRLPFGMPVAVGLCRVDQVSGTALRQSCRYYGGQFSPEEREWRGFSRCDLVDGDEGGQGDGGSSVPLLTRTWFHAGARPDDGREAFYAGDMGAQPPGGTVYTRYENESDVVEDDWSRPRLADAAYALAGRVRRVEHYTVTDGKAASGTPMATTEYRYMVRRLGEGDSKPVGGSVFAGLIETVTYRYDQHAGDPRCDRDIVHAFDQHGVALRQAGVNHARRTDATPPFAEGTPDREHHLRWWQDAHDDAQQAFYLTHGETTPVHIDSNVDWWRVGMPFRNGQWAACVATASINPRTLSWEGARQGTLDPTVAEFVLAAMHTQRYVGVPEGQGDPHGRKDALESAEFDALALSAYEGVLSTDELAERLAEAGYERTSGDESMWSARRNINEYAAGDAFHHLTAVRAATTVGKTLFDYDGFDCMPARMTLPDGCSTTLDYDYRSLRPVGLTDPNGNQQQAAYDGLGRLRAHTFFGHEWDQPAGFLAISEFAPGMLTVDEAVADPAAAVQDAASAVYRDAFSWMGRVDAALLDALSALGLQDRIVHGHVPASLRWLAEAQADAGDRRLAELLDPVIRLPVHDLTITSDQYTIHAVPPPHPAHVGTEAEHRQWQPPARQYRMVIRAYDGFGRGLHTRQKVSGGEAFASDVHGITRQEGGAPLTVLAASRWRVSEPVRYNARGWVGHVYRPYFSDTHRPTDDTAWRDASPVDRLFYDAWGRLVVTLTAAGYMRRTTYYPWHTVDEDENDTAEELEELAAAGVAVDGRVLAHR